MTIWLLALLLLASLAGLGFRQGAIRVGISFFGILIGAMLAAPLGKLVRPAIVALGAKNPVVPWILGPPIIFILFSIIFKVVALTVHQKVDVYYRYKAGDLRLALFERLNARTGLCLGLLNATAYLVLITGVLYPFSYWTVQLDTSDSDPKWMKVVSRFGRDVQNSGFAKVARAMDPMPQNWYDAADLAGLLYQNPLLEARLSRYPALLGLAERGEFSDLSTDKDFIGLRSSQAPIMSVLEYARIQSILQQPDLLKQIWAVVVPDMKDLTAYLQTGKSAKYDPEKILGRWKFNVNVAMAYLRRAKPNISSLEMKKVKLWMLGSFSKATFVAMTDHSGFFGHLPPVKLPGGTMTPSGEKLPCQWQGGPGKYQLTIAGSEVAGTLEDDRLTLATDSLTLVFDRED